MFLKEDKFIDITSRTLYYLFALSIARIILSRGSLRIEGREKVNLSITFISELIDNTNTLFPLWFAFSHGKS